MCATHEEALQLQLEELARLDQIIDELLFLSRVEANAITLNLEQLNPARFLQHFAQDAGVLAEHMACTSPISTTARAGWLRRQAVAPGTVEFVSNALKASPAGGNITLRSVLENGLWRISIEDEGAGLPADQSNASSSVSCACSQPAATPRQRPGAGDLPQHRGHAPRQDLRGEYPRRRRPAHHDRHPRLERAP